MPPSGGLPWPGAVVGYAFLLLVVRVFVLCFAFGGMHAGSGGVSSAVQWYAYAYGCLGLNGYVHDALIPEPRRPGPIPLLPRVSSHIRRSCERPSYVFIGETGTQDGVECGPHLDPWDGLAACSVFRLGCFSTKKSKEWEAGSATWAVNRTGTAHTHAGAYEPASSVKWVSEQA